MATITRRSLLTDVLSGIAVILIVLTPSFVLLGKNLKSGLAADIPVYDDPAIAELYTLRALDGSQHLGPYSRKQFHHPGPSMFYALAPFYEFGNRTHGSLCMGAIVLNMLWVVAIVVTTVYLFGIRLSVWVAISVMIVLLFYSPYYWASVWNPNAGLLPIALALVGCAGLAVRSWSTLPVLVIAASYAAQAHVVYAVFLTAMVASAIIAAFASHKWGVRRQNEKRRFTVSIGLSFLAGAAMWFPVFVSPDATGIKNLIEIVRITLSQGGDWDIVAALGRCSYWLSSAYLAPFGVIAREGFRQAALPLTAPLAVFQLLFFLLIAIRGYRERIVLEFALGFLGGASFLFSLALAAHPEADSFPHLIRWISLCGPVHVGMIVSLLCREDGKMNSLVFRGVATLGWVLLLAIGVIAAKTSLDWMRIGDFIQSGWGKGAYAPAWESLAPMMNENCSAGSHIRILEDEFWPYAAGVFLQLERSGQSASVDERWQFMFGNDESTGLLVTDCLTVLSETGPADYLSDEYLVARLPTRHGLLGIRTYTQNEGNGTSFFALDDRSFAHLIESGFHGFEPDSEGGSRWSSDTRSVFNVFLQAGVAHSMEFLAQPFNIPDRRQTAHISVNGTTISSLEMHSSWETYTVPIPPSLVREFNRIAIAYEYTESPIAIGRSNDSRKLAVRFRSFRFSATQNQR